MVTNYNNNNINSAKIAEIKYVLNVNTLNFIRYTKNTKLINVSEIIYVNGYFESRTTIAVKHVYLIKSINQKYF